MIFTAGMSLVKAFLSEAAGRRLELVSSIAELKEHIRLEFLEEKYGGHLKNVQDFWPIKNCYVDPLTMDDLVSSRIEPFTLSVVKSESLHNGYRGASEGMRHTMGGDQFQRANMEDFNGFKGRRSTLSQKRKIFDPIEEKKVTKAEVERSPSRVPIITKESYVPKQSPRPSRAIYKEEQKKKSLLARIFSCLNRD